MRDLRDLDDFVELRLPEIKKREVPFENQLRDELKKRGIGFVKNKPTIEGWPDRTLMGFGRIRLVEVKKEDGDLSEVQKILHRELVKKYGVKVIVVHGPDVRATADDLQRALRGY
jgi:hypothetical protein